MVGIYLIENKVNGKRYVGQSWDIEKRWRSHRNDEYNKHLKTAFKKYGIDNFEFRVLCELHNEEQTQERLNDLEIAYIDILDTLDPTKGYNNREGGNCGRHSEESKIKMSINNAMKLKPEVRLKVSNSLKGRKWSDASKDKLSVSKSGVKFTEEHKTNISKATKGKKKAPRSEEYLRKLSIGHTGLKQSYYTVFKRRCTQLGYIVEFELETLGTKVYVG